MFELLQKMRDPQQGLLVYVWVGACERRATIMVDMRCIEHSLCEWDKYEKFYGGRVNHVVCISQQLKSKGQSVCYTLSV